MADAAKQAQIQATASTLANVLLTEMQFPTPMQAHHKKKCGANLV